MAVYFRGSACGEYIKVGHSSEPAPNGRYSTYENQAHGFIQFPHPLVYVTTIGGNDKDAESRIKRYFYNDRLITQKPKREYKEVFPIKCLGPYVTWIILQWFSETDPYGLIVPEPVNYEDFAPSSDRVSLARKEESLEALFEAEENPFYYLPDTKIEPTEDYVTPLDFIEPVRAAFGGTIDLDVASHPYANRTVKALNYFTKSMNGLMLPWNGRCWLYLQHEDWKVMEAWLEKASSEIYKGNVSDLIVLSASRSLGSDYYQPHLKRAAAICLVRGGGPVFKGRGQITMNVSVDRWAFVYYGQNVERFRRAFEHLGVVCEI